MTQKTTTFAVRVNNGPEQTIEVRSSIYRVAALAVPAIIGLDDFPVLIEIWVPDLVSAGYGPYLYTISEDEYGALRLAHAPLAARAA